MLALAAVLRAADFHVAPTGNDANPGTMAAPLRSIQRSADLAQPGDVVTVHKDNLVDLIHSIRAADPRIGGSVGLIVGESSDQNATLNAARIAAVAELNGEIGNSAAYFDTDNMIGAFWGNMF